MLSMITRQYPLPEQSELRFFRDEEHFLEKVKKHFLNPNEPWSRLFGARFLRQFGKELRAGNVSNLEAVYAKAVDVLDHGIKYAVKKPLFLSMRQQITDMNGSTFTRSTMHFLSDKGFRVVAHGGVVRTAWFGSTTPTDSYYTLFRESWRALRSTASKASYLDRDQAHTVKNLEVSWHNDAHWRRCPNPYDRPRLHTRSGKIPPRVAEWLDELGCPETILSL